MDFSFPAFDGPRDDAAARNRFENFKLGNGLPSTVGPKHGHARSHSRNLSISSSLSFPPSKSTNVNDLSPSQFSFPSANPGPVLSPTNQSFTPSPTALTHPIPPSKRNSHHRRRSSVSTRHESAEMMGVALPDLPPSTSDDNINLGEKDSIRRRALWALEGKPDVSFNKVEIPDISTPDIEKMLFDFTTKSSSYGSGLNSLAGKRDSFKLLGPSSSSKDTLGTLVEEEEEEDDSIDPLPSPDSIKENLPPPNTPITPITPALSITKATPAKPRPSNLNLRPLSLTPENLFAVAPSLPSPSLTPSPRPGLRSLALTPSPAPSVDDPSNVKQARRSSLVVSPTPSSRRPILNLALEKLEHASSMSTASDDDSKPSRRSSISYKRSNGGVTMNIAGLPTPEMTPTFSRRYSNAESLASADDEVFPSPPTQTRPLSASEQHFLFKSHNALLARITDLERALSMRRRESGGYSNGGSRPMSVASNSSSSSDLNSGSAASEPSDEMLRLIADLKAERDELKRDVDGWRTRVGDMENQMGVLAKRVENERRDAWVARSRVGLLEVEKGVLSKKMEALDELVKAHEEDRRRWEKEKETLMKESVDTKERVGELEEELDSVKQELETEKQKKAKAKLESDPLSTPTPRAFDSFNRPGMGLSLNKRFMSVDSESSVTDVDPDSSDDNAFSFGLKSVQEESDDANDNDEYTEVEEEDVLAGYEDEEEDMNMSIHSSSSFGSEEDLPRSVAHLQQQNFGQSHNTGFALPASPTTPRPQVFTPPRSGHARRATLSKTWTFPFGFGGQHTQTPPKEEDEKQDRFFGCLDDIDSDASGSVPNSPSAYSYEKSKGVFSNGFKFAPADDNASFFLPGGIGMPAEDDDERRLDAVAEEEEADYEQDGKYEAEYEQDGKDSKSDIGVDDDDDSDMFGEIGGIRITFTPPQEELEVKEEKKQIQLVSPLSVKRTSPPPMLPALDFGNGDDEEEEDEEENKGVIPFNFGRSLASPEPTVTVPIVAVPAVVVTPISTSSRPASPSMIPRPASPSARPASPSMVPRPTSPASSFIPRATVSISRPAAPSASSISDFSTSTPTKISPMRAVASSASGNSFITPPNKRGGALPSFIPQPVSSPSPLRSLPSSMPSSTTTTRPKVIPTSTFIRQPARKPLLPTVTAPSTGPTAVKANGTNVPPAGNVGSLRRSSAHPRPALASLFDTSGSSINHYNSSAQMKSVDLSHDLVFAFSQSPPPQARFQPHPQTKHQPRPTTSRGSQAQSRSSSSVSSTTSASSTSISSLMSISSPLSASARLSFQTFTNLIPLSWAPLSNAAAVPVPPEGDFDDDDHTVVQTAAVPRKSTGGGYVSREKQLRKLKARMEVEGVLAMRAVVDVRCKKCDGDVVFI